MDIQMLGKVKTYVRKSKKKKKENEKKEGKNYE